MFSANANTITKIQLITGILVIIGFFYFPITIENSLITIISFYIYSIFGISLTLHRYYSHKSFEFKYKLLKWIFTLIAILCGRGSPIGWVYVHRLHHANADTENDPHSPNKLGFKIFGFKHIEEHSKKMNYFLIKELIDPIQLKINKYYFLIILTYVFLLGFIGLDFLYFTWILPVFLIQISQNCFNYFAHKHGYRNFDTKDNSTNNTWLWIFILGDAWHNNHHKDPKNMNTKIKKYEFDPLGSFINLIKKPTPR